MAYNPFDFFRRFQKTLFGILTVFVMFMFVLSFGAGDFFQWLPSLLRGWRAQGKEVMAVVDGRKVMDAQLYDHDEGRALANDFMLRANAEMTSSLEDYIRDGQARATKPTQDKLKAFLQDHGTGYFNRAYEQILERSPNPQQMFEQLTQMTMQQHEREMRSIIDAANATTEDKELATTAILLMARDRSSVTSARNGRTYFVNLPPAQTFNDRLEYDLWLRKADKLGINIGPDAAALMVSDEFDNRFKAENWSRVEKTFRESGRTNYSRAKVLTALANEFKVRAAMATVLGRAATALGSNTPYETYQFYKQQCDAGTFALLAVPAENYLDKVTATPTDSELRTLFDKYKNQEPNPIRETPGFREPRKLKLGWFEVSGKEPYYTKLGEESYKLNDVGFGIASLAPSVVSPFLATAYANVSEPLLQNAYTKYREQFSSELRTKWYPFRPAQDDSVLETSTVRPQILGAALASMIGSQLTGAGALPTGMIVRERALQYERNARARVMVALLAPPIDGALTLGHAIAGGLHFPEPLPLATVKDQLLTQVKSDLARQIAERDIATMSLEASRLGQKKDKSEARAVIDKFISERGLKSGASAEFRDAFSMDTDPGLTPLAAKLQRGMSLSDEPMQFGPYMFVMTDPRTGQPQPSVPLTYYAPEAFPRTQFGIMISDEEPTLVTWRAETVDPETPREFEKAKPKVLAAWKRMKARELAKAAAEDLRKRIETAIKAEKAEGAAGIVDRVVRDVHAKFVNEQFKTAEQLQAAAYLLQTGVSPLQSNATPFAAMNQGEPQRFMLRPRRGLLYPTITLQKELLATKDKPLGSTLLESDMPKDVYYVGVLQSRDDNTPSQFESTVLSGFNSVGMAVRNEQNMVAGLQAREQALALLKAEFKVTNENPKLKDKVGAND